MKPVIYSFLFLFAFSPFGNHIAGMDSRGWTPEYMMQFKRVGSTQISPDGQWVAYTVSEARMEGEKSDFLTHIHITSTDGREQFQLTRGYESARNPQWSSDGNYIAFLSPRDSDGNQIWLIRLRGGEAERITDIDGGVNNFSWSPDGRRIAFTRTDPLTDEQKQRLRERRDVIVVDTEFRYSHLYTVAVKKKNDGERPVKRLTKGEFHVGNFDWSPDGKYIVFDHQPTPRVNDWVLTSISVVPSDSGQVRLLIDQGGMDANPKFSPDGQWVAFASDGGIARWPRAFDLHVISFDGVRLRKLPETFDRQPSLLAWSNDGSRLFYTESHRTSFRLFSIPVDQGSYEIITTGSGVYSGISLNNNATILAAIHENFDVPPDVVVSPVRRFDPKRLTNVNAGFQKFPMGKGKVITYTSPDGLEIESPLIFPVNFEEGRRYPLILMVHGGPAGVYRETYSAASSTYPLQAFAQEGYFVLRPNFRGSSGYGKEFRFANIADWGFGDYEDLMAGVDYLIERGMVHPDSLAILGWSYGGFMTAFAITRTNRFKAAVVGAGVTNLVSMTGTSDIPGFLPDYFEAELWENYERYIRHSPMFHVENITTPTLILHPKEDIRVPPSQGWELYTALSRRGVETQLVLYPREPHVLLEPKFIQDAGERQIRWLNKHIRGKVVE